MKFIRTDDFRPQQAWAARDIGEIDGVGVRVHWTDQPYRWHVNDGAEVFGVLQGMVWMHWRDADDQEQKTLLKTGDFCHAEAGDAHVAHPCGEALVLVVERKGSI